MISLRTPRSEPRNLEGKLNVVRIGIQGSNQACGEALSWGSAVVPSQTVVRTELRATMAPTMPNVVECMLDDAFWCFPHASPALTFRAGKRPTTPKDRSKSLIFLRKTGAGEGIRTLDPNLGKVPERSTPWYPAVRYDTKLYDKSFSWLTSNPPPVSQTYPTTCFQLLGIRVDEGV